MAVECLRAQELAAEIGISAEVIDPIFLVPLDMETIIASTRRTGRLLVVDNAWTRAGASAEIVAAVAERLSAQNRIRDSWMGFAPAPCPTTLALEKAFYPSPETIAARVRHDVPEWEPDAEKAALAYHRAFRGPF